MQGLLSYLISLVLYLFFCYCFKLICQKAGTDPGILIWIPLLQLFPLLKTAGLAYWTFLLFFVPVVNVVLFVMMWARILKALGRNPWLVILLLLPAINLLYILYLAFSNGLTQPENTLASKGPSSEMPSLDEGAASATTK